MENTEIEKKLENIEILLSAFIQSSNDPKRRAAEGEFLAKAIESINSTQNELSGLISQEKDLIQGFNPVVEVRHLSVNVKQPLYWIAGAIFAILISFAISFYLYEKKEAYRQESELKDWNYMKYKYLKLFSDPRTTKNLDAFDAEYLQNWIEYDKKINKREKELEEAARATRAAELKAKEANDLQHRADSLKSLK